MRSAQGYGTNEDPHSLSFCSISGLAGVSGADAITVVAESKTKLDEARERHEADAWTWVVVI